MRATAKLNSTVKSPPDWRPPNGRVCVLGMGNRLWGDDGAGSYLADQLRQVGFTRAIDGGIAPENHLAAVADALPETILIVDATDFGGYPGEFRVMDPQSLAVSSVSTHAGSPLMLARYLEARTAATVFVLGIQPGSTSAGEKLSPAVRRTINHLLERLNTSS